tara:strand:- start:121 stop:456 length:336 start_codon:yes stop_codon:yes gene_type:complete
MKKIVLDNAIESGVVLADLSSLWFLKLRLEKSFKKDLKNTKIKNLLHKVNDDIKKLEKKLNLLNKKPTKLKKQKKLTVVQELARETREIYKKADEDFLKGFSLKPKSQKTK